VGSSSTTSTCGSAAWAEAWEGVLMVASMLIAGEV
jgi:hypothetical protein